MYTINIKLQIEDESDSYLQEFQVMFSKFLNDYQFHCGIDIEDTVKITITK